MFSVALSSDPVWYQALTNATAHPLKEILLGFAIPKNWQDSPYSELDGPVCLLKGRLHAFYQTFALCPIEERFALQIGLDTR